MFYKDSIMHFMLSLFLIVFSVWTIAVHVGLLLNYALNNVLNFFLLLILPAIIINKNLTLKKLYSGNYSNKFLIKPNIKFTQSNLNFILLLFLCIPIILYWSWITFWGVSVFILLFSIFNGNNNKLTVTDLNTNALNKIELIVIFFIVLIGVLLSLSTSRSDLDDAFYASVAAFVSANPEIALNMVDPMLGEPGLPMIFPSYRFASFEVLSGLGGYLFSVHAIDFYYIYFVPIWMVISVIVMFLLTKELFPQYWLITGCLAFMLTILLGEMHRSPANFSFQRIFQGKAVFLSVVVPAIFYLTARYFSNKGNKSDLFLIGCCQISSIGLTNFGMLMGPIVGFTAILSNILLIKSSDSNKFLYAFLTLLIPLPYLIDVAIESRTSAIIDFNTESAFDVWESVFGFHQQYLVGILLLAGPILAKDSVTRWRLAVPPLLLFIFFLNPYFSHFISKYITTPPVYWRVVWSFPILIFTAISMCMIFIEMCNTRFTKFTRCVLLLLVVSCCIYSLPFNALRKTNIGEINTFGEWKIPKNHLRVCNIAMEYAIKDQRVLAPDEIAGVISRFENHPKLINTRGFYLKLLESSFTINEYVARTALYNFVTDNHNIDRNLVIKALSDYNVSVVILRKDLETNEHLNILYYKKYYLKETIEDYSIWIKN